MSVKSVCWKSTSSKTGTKHSKHTQKTPEFGLLVDIDGVIVRGNKLIPGSKEAFHDLLTVGE